MRLMESNYTQPVNIGNPREMTILTFAEQIQVFVVCCVLLCLFRVFCWRLFYRCLLLLCVVVCLLIVVFLLVVLFVTLFGALVCLLFSLLLFAILNEHHTQSLLSDRTDMIEHKPAVEDDPQQRQPDIGVAKRELNWEPKVCSICRVLLCLSSFFVLLFSTFVAGVYTRV